MTAAERRQALVTQVHVVSLPDGEWQASVIYDDATEGTACGGDMDEAIALAMRDEPCPIRKGAR